MGRQRKRRSRGFRATLEQHQVLQSVAEEYDLRILQAERKNGVFRINTSQGWKKFKAFRYSPLELEFVHGVLEHLAGKGWKRSMPLHLTKDGKPWIQTSIAPFYVTTWVQGAEIDPEDPAQLDMAAKTLGEMHQLLQDFQSDTQCHRESPPDWQIKYGKRAEDLKRYQEQAETNRKPKFSRRFRQVSDDFLRMMGIGLQLLQEADYEGLRWEDTYITVCHTSPIASNLIAGHDGRIYIIDFDNARTDLRIYDVARMIVRHSGWDMDKAVFMLHSYQEANPLTLEEMAILPALCAFPSRGWQVARSFYDSDKMHLDRLEAAISDIAKQEVFVRALAKRNPAELVHRPTELFQTIPYPRAPVDPHAESTVQIPVEGSVPDAVVSEPVPLEADSATELHHVASDAPAKEQVGSSFYWGEVDAVYEGSDDDQLMALCRQLTNLAQRLDVLTDAIYGPRSVEDDLPDKSWLFTEQKLEGAEGDEPLEVIVSSGEEMPVEVAKPYDEPLEAEWVICESGELSLVVDEVAVRGAVGYLGTVYEEEGEVRLDIATGMEDMLKETSVEKSVSVEDEFIDVATGDEIFVSAPYQASAIDEGVEQGVEIPVEYTTRFEPQAGEVLHQESTGPVMDEEPLELKALELSKEEESEERIELMVSSEADPRADEYLHVQREEIHIAEADKVIEETTETMADDCGADEVEATDGQAWVVEVILEPIIDDAVGLVSQVVPEALMEESDMARPVVPVNQEESQQDHAAVQDERMELKSHGGSVTHWGDFPEPLGGRRRGRERRLI